MKRLFALSLAVLIIALAGCGLKSPPTQEELIRADFGQYPHNYQEIVKARFNPVLFDPYTAVYELNPPRKAYIYKFEYIYGYGVQGTINAKNRFGGYVGAKGFSFLIYNGRIIDDMMLLNFVE